MMNISDSILLCEIRQRGYLKLNLFKGLFFEASIVKKQEGLNKV